jgi:dual specificity MAP kinase phosphatase
MLSVEDKQAYQETEANGGLSPIWKNKLFLCGRNPPQNFDLIKEKNITHILSLTHMEIDKLENDDKHLIKYKRIGIADHQGERLIDFFDEAHAFIDEAFNKGTAVIVHCDAGVSRSATMIIAYLMRRKKLSPKDAFRHVRSRRPIISPNLGFAEQLIEFEHRLHPKSNAMPFRILFMRNHFGYGTDDSDEEIQKALEVNESDFMQAHYLLRAKTRKTPLLTAF